MIDDPLALLSMSVWLFAAGMWPVAFLFGACSPCCQPGDPCPWLLEFDRCLRVSIVGSDPPDGGDCRVVSSRAGTGDVEFMQTAFFRIHNAQSRIRITVRLSLSASGASRTPVGETRTQVWRLNRAAPTSLPETAYDVIGPPWHLQVDVSVTGVATQEEAGVVSSIETDEHGQPKLVLTVNQWTSNITYDEVVTLFPVGLQRWDPADGSEFFRLTTSSLSATRVSGDNYSGWSVSKQSGLSIEERKLAVRFTGTLCAGGAGGVMTPRIVLNDVTATNFLNGDEDLRVGASAVGITPAGDRDLRILPNNALCEASRDLVGMGVALGIYPAEIYADVPSSIIESNAAWCAEEATFALKPNSNICPTSWASAKYQRPSLEFPAGTLFVGATASNFWPGRTLLWNIENGPYRNSFTGSGPGSTTGWTYRIDGDGGNLDPFFLSPLNFTGCRPELNATSVQGQPVPNLTCIPPFVEVSWEERPVTYIVGNPDSPFAVIEDSMPGGSVSVGLGGLLVSAGSCAGTQFGWPETNVIHYFATGGEFEKTLDVPGFAPPTILCDVVCVVVGSYDPCSVPYSMPLRFRGYLRIISTVLCTEGGSCFTTQYRTTEDVINETERSEPGLFGIPCATEEYLSHVSQDVTIDIAHRLRRVCGPWSPSPVSAEGETIARDCEITDSEVVAEAVTETFSVPASRSRFPNTLGRYPFAPSEADQLTQLGRCRLLGLRNMRGSTTATVAATLTLGSAPAINSCFSYLPMFGETAGTLCSGDFSSFTAVPCDNCTVSVTQTAGEENASVRLITSGDKAGLIEINVKRTWLGGQGVTFTVSCGNDTITQVVRRADTVPTAPTNLTAVRDPCSTATLAWEAPHDGGQPITGYRVEYRPFNIGSYILFDTVPANSLSAVVTGLLRLGYQFRVAATNSLGTGAFSNIAVVDGFTLGAPTSLTFTRDPCDEVQLSWTPPATTECVFPASYRLEYRVGLSGTFLVFGTVAGTQTTGTVTGLDPTLQYQFRVARVADAGGDLFSNTVTSGSVPATPTGVVAVLGTEPGEVDLTWNAVEQLCFPNTDYLVQFRPSTTFTWSDFARAASADKFATVTGLTPATYFFRVRATNSIGNSGFSAQSNSVTIPEPE